MVFFDNALGDFSGKSRERRMNDSSSGILFSLFQSMKLFLDYPCQLQCLFIASEARTMAMVRFAGL
jgi:hypothetical protein